MVRRVFVVVSLVSACLLLSCGSQNATDSDLQVTHGKQESGFPAVVQIRMDRGTICTGTFLSDSLLLTAAHCVDDAESVEWNGVKVLRPKISIHPGWPLPGASCSGPALPQFDLAMVEFPAGTYEGISPPLLKRSLRVDEEIRIVGFGHNVITPLDRYCRVARQKSPEGMCRLQMGERKQNLQYEYEVVSEFPPVEPASACAASCTVSGLKKDFREKQLNFTDFVKETCGGKLMDRVYLEAGIGKKRSGLNRIAAIRDGLVRFYGGVGGTDSGLNAASGAGDSGGPMLVLEKGVYKIAAITHGGGLTSENDAFLKTSVYVELNAAHHRSWLGTFSF